MLKLAFKVLGNVQPISTQILDTAILYFRLRSYSFEYCYLPIAIVHINDDIIQFNLPGVLLIHIIIITCVVQITRPSP